MHPQAPKSVYVPKAPPMAPKAPVPVTPRPVPKAPPMDPTKETPEQAKKRAQVERRAIKEAARKAANPEKYTKQQKHVAKRKAEINKKAERKAVELMTKINPYVYDKPRVLPNGMPGTLKGLAEAFFEMDLEAIKEFEPRTVAEAAVRAAWLKASYGDTKAMNMLWNRIHAVAGPANPLADMLVALGQAAALKPTTLSQSQPGDQDED